MAKSTIEWTDETWNPVAGCEAVSPGCANCYAARMTRRLEAMGQKDYAGLTTDKHFNGTVRCLPDKLMIPLKWKKPRMVFVNSMSDLFHKDVPDEFIIKCFAIMLLCQPHTFQVLTKRPDRMRRICGAPNFRECVHDMAFDLSHMNACGGLMDHVPETGVLPNVWLGTSCENQPTADERIPLLLKAPAAVRFLSCEPLLSNIDFFYGEQTWGLLTGIDWVIVGGESGHGARPCNLAWIRSIVEQCKAAGVACFVKQLGADPYRGAGLIREGGGVRVDKFTNDPNGPIQIALNLKDSKGGDMAEWPDDLRNREFPKVTA